MAQGIILAGGLSQRAKTNKATLLFEGKTFLDHALITMTSILDLVVVVTGKYHESTKEITDHYKNVKVIRNLNYQKGMFASVKSGVSLISDDFFILPIDCPLVKKETFKALLNSKSSIAVPTYENKNGHPIFIKKSLIVELLREDDNYNLKSFRDTHNCEFIEVNDANILNDIDTKKEYEELLKVEENR